MLSLSPSSIISGKSEPVSLAIHFHWMVDLVILHPWKNVICASQTCLQDDVLRTVLGLADMIFVFHLSTVNENKANYPQTKLHWEFEPWQVISSSSVGVHPSSRFNPPSPNFSTFDSPYISHPFGNIKFLPNSSSGIKAINKLKLGHQTTSHLSIWEKLFLW